MSKGRILKTLVTERLTAAAEEIFALFERTIAEYEEELCRSKKENERKQALLDAAPSPRVPPRREDVQIQTEQPHKEESNRSVKLEEELSQEVTRVVVKSEFEEISDDEADSEPPCSSSVQQMETDQSQRDPAAAQSTNDDTSGSDALECPVCESKLRHSQDFGENPYGCSVCEREFRQRNLQTHVIHSDDVEDFLHEIQTNENGEEATAEELSDGVDRAGSPEIEIEIEEEKQVCQKDSDKAATAQNSSKCSKPKRKCVEKNLLQGVVKSNVRKSRTKRSKKVKFTCPQCEKTFKLLHHLQRHVLTHTGERSFSCSVCQKSFKLKQHLTSHMAVHTGERLFECSICDKTFNRKDNLRTHLRNHSGARPHKCPQCDVRFSLKKNLARHMVVHDRDTTFTCSVYNGSQPEFPAKAGPSLEHDGLLHELQIKEEQLQEATPESEDQQRQTEHEEEEADMDYENWIQSWETPSGSSYEPLEPDEVENSDAGSSFIQTMLSTNKTKKKNPAKMLGSDAGAKTKHECPVCKKKLGRKQELKRHMLLHTGEKPFSCPVCEKRFIQKSNLKSHIVTHLDSVDTFLRHQKPSEKDSEGEGLSSDAQHNSVDVSSDSDDGDDGSSSLHTDADADHYHRDGSNQSRDGQNASPVFKSFQEDQSTLERISFLLNQALSDSKERGKTTEYQCPICTKIFGRMENLRRHLLIHTGEKPFSCPVCNKCFTLKQHLKLHMVVHTGEKQFNCSVCAKTFNRKDNLRSHMKVHSIDRPFGCSECGARFTLNKNLMRHMAVHTGQTPYSCTVCNSGFSSQLCLKRHVKIHNKDTQK